MYLLAVTFRRRDVHALGRTQVTAVRHAEARHAIRAQVHH